MGGRALGGNGVCPSRCEGALERGKSRATGGWKRAARCERLRSLVFVRNAARGPGALARARRNAADA